MYLNQLLSGISIFILMTLTLFSNSAMAALPVFPGATGFGTETPAGSGRHLDTPKTTIFKITNLNASGPGSFQECVYARIPRTCVFEVSGTIDLTGDKSYDGSHTLNISNPYITIAGQTAPSPGITIKGKTMAIRSHDVLIQHMRFRVGDDPNGGTAPSARDGIVIIGKKSDPNRRPYNIVLDHITVSWGIDETFTAKDTSSYITISNSLISEGLQNSLHRKGAHSKGMMNSADYFTSYRNIIAHNADRVPLDTSPTSVHVNNLTYNSIWGGQLANLRNNKLHTGKVRKNTIIGNIRIRGNDSQNGSNQEYLQLIFENPEGSRIYIEDNQCETYHNHWPCVLERKPGNYRTFEAPVMHEEMSILTADEAKTYLLQNAGARPLDRDDSDSRIIEDIKNLTGYIPDCVEEKTCANHAGGWPDLAENFRPLDIPLNYNTLQASGYTVLEEFLFNFYKDVQPSGHESTSEQPQPVIIDIAPPVPTLQQPAHINVRPVAQLAADPVRPQTVVTAFTPVPEASETEELGITQTPVAQSAAETDIIPSLRTPSSPINSAITPTTTPVANAQTTKDATNTPPIAHAGKDLDLTDLDRDGYILRSLKGTKSFDPDGDRLSYKWYVNGELISTRMVLKRHNFALGTNKVYLLVEDGRGGSDKAEITVRVMYPRLK